MGKRKPRKRWRKSSLIRRAPYPNQGVLREYLHHAQGLGQDERYINALVCRFWKIKELPERFSASKLKIEQQIRELRDALPVERFVVIGPKTETCVHKLYFSFDDRKAFIIKEDAVTRTVSKSTTFYNFGDMSARERAVAAFLSKRITYLFCVQFDQFIQFPD